MNKKKKTLSKKEVRAIEKAELRRLEEEKKKQETRYKIIESTQSLLPIRDIFDGVIVTKDDRFVKVLEFKPLNFMYLAPATRNMITSEFAAMLKMLPMDIQLKTFSRKADVEGMLASIKQYHETETNGACRKMQEEYMAMLRKTALSEGVTRRFFIILEHYNSIGNDGTDFDYVVGELEAAAARIRSSLERIGNECLRDCETETGLYELMYQLLNRRKSETVPFAEHADGVAQAYLQAFKADNSVPPISAPEFVAPQWIDFSHAKHVVIDDKFYTYAYIPSYGYNNAVVSGWLGLFVNACEGIDVDIFLKHYPREEIYSKISSQVKLKRAKAYESHDTDLDFHQLQGTISSGEYMLAGLSNGEDFYYLTIVLTITADTLDELEYRYKELEKRAKGRGITLQRATFHMEEAFESVLPICKVNKAIDTKARRNVLTSGASSCYPFTSFEMQDPDGIMLGTNVANNSLVAVDIFDTKAHPNANGAIFGKSGYGKTFTAQLLALRMRMKQIQTFIIVPMKGREDYKRAADHVGGQYVSMGLGSSYSINVMDIRVPDDEGAKLLEGYESSGSLLSVKTHNILTFLHLVVRDMTQEEEQLIDGCIYKTYEKFGITEDNESVFIPGTREYKTMPILGDLREMMEGIPELARVRNILTPLISGSMASFNRRTNVDLDNLYIVFDMDGLTGPVLIMSMFIVLDFVWSRIKEDRTKRKAVFLDEAWKLIGTESNRMAAEYVLDMFKTIRAFGGGAFVITQEVSDMFSLDNGKYGNGIIGNADTKIVLHLDPKEANRLQDVMQLTDDEVDNVMKLKRGNGLISTSGSKLFANFTASNHEKNILTTDPAVLRAEAERNRKRKEEEEMDKE